MGKQRLQKILAAAGVDSRRNCEQLILQGAVKVNGRTVETLPAFADPEVDIITVAGRRIRPVEKVYYLLNKPKGVVCTNSDPQGRKKAIDLIDAGQRIFCVGRLDIDTTGAIILTNDTELANRLTHPRYELPKSYIMRIRGRISDEAVEKLKKGVWLSEGKTRTARVEILGRGANESTLEVTISEGLNRQIRRMMARVGYKVLGLKRVGIGRIGVRGLGVGRFRRLAGAEVAYLKKVTSRKVS